MDEKKQIGKKIWELFSKNYTYSDIANILKINKSVVSNVINYSLPAHTWIWEDLKELRHKHEQDLKELKQKLKEKDNEIGKLKQELREKEDEIEIEREETNDTFLNITISVILYIVITAIILFFVRINFYHNLILSVSFIIYSIALIVALIFGIQWVRE